MIRAFARRVDHLLASPPITGTGAIDAEVPPLPLAFVFVAGALIGGVAMRQYFYAEKTGVVSHLNETYKGMKTKFGVSS